MTGNDDWMAWDGDTWRSWDAARLQDQVSPSSMVPGRDITPWLEWYRQAGEEALTGAPHGVEALRYGSHPDEVLSWVPAGTKPAPLVVFIHGGYWVALSHTDGLFAGPALARRGFHYASINYTLAPDASLEMIVDQCRRAVRFLLDHPDLPIDTTRVVLAGHSAGGHLAAMCADVAPGAGLLGFSGVYDLEPLLTTTVNVPLGLDADRARALSPMSRPAPALGASLLVVGADDPDHFKAQTRRYCYHLRDANDDRPNVGTMDGRMRWRVTAGTNHFDVIAELADADSAVGRWLGHILVRD